ncbi:MAG TPA: prepilin-type N-terminal cleavage/methylation domain-containing protein [Acidimicrobiia bacterium]|nr:prepilin-type N-terminal cleavage/methylation domain-containing protein [Acidimicrobiia bacterium]
MSVDRSTARRGDEGLTLVELVVVIALLGLVMLVLSATFIVISRTNPTSEARADGARALLGMSAWLPEDVSSAIPGDAPGGGFDFGGDVCASGQGTPLVGLLSIDAATGIEHGRDYLLTVRNDDPVVVRVTCEDGGSLTSNFVTGPLSEVGDCPGTPATASAWVLPVTTAGTTIGVRFYILVDCDVVELNATTNNPNEAALPPPGTVLPPTTTSPQENRQPELAQVDYVVDVHETPGASVSLYVLVSDPDGDPLTVTFSGFDPALAPTSVGTFVTITHDGSVPVGESRAFDYTVSDGRGGEVSGTITVGVISESTPTTVVDTTTTTTTTLPCTGASIVSASPSRVSNGGADDVGPLNREVSIMVNLGSNCPQLGLLFDPLNPDGSSPPVPDLRWRPFNGSPSLVITRTEYSWGDGFHTFQLKNDSNNSTIIDSIIVEIAP